MAAAVVDLFIVTGCKLSFALGIKIFAVFTLRKTAGSFDDVFKFNVVSFRAPVIIVVNIFLLFRINWFHSWHILPPLCLMPQFFARKTKYDFRMNRIRRNCQ